VRLGLITSNSPIAPRGDLYEVVYTPDSPPPRNLRERELYDRDMADVLRTMDVDYVVVAGYEYVLTAPMLEAFPSRIIVVHNGDLIDRDEFGQRRWLGPQPVLDALLAGVKATRTSLFFATDRVGEGPLFLVGPRHAVPALVQDALSRGDYDSVAAYAHLHSRWMREGWKPLLERAIEILAAGSMRIVDNLVWIDGVPGPCRLGEAPDACHEPQRIPGSCPFIQERV
jgi:folate-dependent phosphoribosylglycinamide formyltransferase PurN